MFSIKAAVLYMYISLENIRIDTTLYVRTMQMVVTILDLGNKYLL